MGLFEMKQHYRARMVMTKFKLLFLLSTTKKATKPVHNHRSRPDQEHPAAEELVAGRLSVKEYLRPSERLVFERAGSTRSILEAAKVPFPDCVVVAVLDTDDPTADFRASMEEVVEALGIDRSSEQLAELLSWYLRVNRVEHRCYIVQAFVDMFTGSSLFLP